MTSLTKKDIYDNLAKNTILDLSNSKKIVELFFNEIKCSLENGEHVKLSGFGNFSLIDKTPRPGRNPRTGEDVVIEARRVVTFLGGGKLKESISQYHTK